MSDAPPDPTRWRSLAICLTASAMTLLDRPRPADRVPGRSGPVHPVQRRGRGCARPDRAGYRPGRQGLGGGLIAPQTSGFIQNLFRGAERARAFGLLGAAIGISTAIGPLLGGLLVNLGGPGFGWRLVFYVNVPIGLVLLPLALRLLPAGAPARTRQSLDPVGVALFAAAMLLILFPLVEGQQDQPLRDRPWWLVIPALGLLAGCLLWERFWSARGRETLIDLPLLKVRS